MKTEHSKPEQNSNSRSLALGIFLLLLGVTAAFFAFKSAKEHQLAMDFKQSHAEVNAEYEQLSEDFAELNKDYMALKNENIEMDAELQAKIEALEAEKAKVGEMIRNGGNQLRKASKKIEELQVENEQLKATIQRLVAENEALKVENANLAFDLEEQVDLNGDLTENNLKLTADLNEITQERDELLPIANYGRVVRVDALEAEAVRTKRNGKEHKAKHRNAEQLKLCFQLEDNPVVDGGEQNYVIRIVTPEGNVLFEEQNGSGTFVSLEDGGSEIRYTSEAKVDLSDETSNVCWYWAQTQGYQGGNYLAEIYNRGYKVGTESFQL